MAKRIQNPREVSEIRGGSGAFLYRGRLGLFLAETGIGPETLRSAAANPHFLASVLDFILRDDGTVRAFAATSQLDPATIAAARDALDEGRSEPDPP